MFGVLLLAASGLRDDSPDSSPSRDIHTAASPHTPILIEGDAEFTAANGVTGGSGTWYDPFVIEGWEIDASGASGIEVRNTTAAFMIKNVTVRDGASASSFDGISLANVLDARIETATLSGNFAGIAVRLSDNVTVSSSLFTGNVPGVWVEDSSAVRVRNVTIEDGITGIRIRYVERLEVSGATISGMNDWAIDVVGLSRGIIQNSTVARNTQGLYLEDAVHVQLVNNTFANHGGPGTGPGIIGFLVGDLTVSNNLIRDNGGTGISLEYAVDVVLSSNTVANNSGGVWLRTASNVVGTSNRIIGDRHVALWAADAFNMTLQQNEIVDGGLFLSATDLDLLASYDIGPDNVVNGAPLYYLKRCADLEFDDVPIGQLIVVDCSGISLSNVSIHNADIAIHVVRSQNVTVSSSNLSDNQIIAARFEEVRGLAFSDNELFRNGVGLATFVAIRSENLTIRGNRISDGGTIHVDLSRDVNLGRNRIERAGGGLRLDQLERVTVEGNDMADNWDGMWLTAVRDADISTNNLTRNRLSIQYSSNITVFGNRFVDSAVDDGGSSVRWNETYPIGGNFWSTYAGWDDCSGVDQDDCTVPDGFGDVPYVIDGDSTDHYPIVGVNPPNEPPVATFTYRPTLLFTGTTVAFDASGSFDPDGLPLTFDWDFGDGGFATGSGPFVTHRYASFGTHLVKVTVTDVREGSGMATASLRVESLPVPGFDVTPGQPIAGDVLTFDASASYDLDGAILEYQWTFGDGSIGSGVVVTHTYILPGAYRVTLTVTDSSGLVASQSRYLFVDPLPPQVPPETPLGFGPLWTLIGLGLGVIASVLVAVLLVRKRNAHLRQHGTNAPTPRIQALPRREFTQSFCPNCGYVATPDQKFCGRCGSAIPSPPSAGEESN